eukprot:7700736-Karenia_brevis.AAC.1
MEQWQSETHDDFGREINDQIIQNQITLKRCSDGDIFLSPKSGVPPGLYNATGIFNNIYGQVLSTYYDHVKCDTNMCVVES